MAGEAASYMHVVFPFSEEINDGLTVLATIKYGNNSYCFCSLYHGGSWEHFSSTAGSSVVISNIEKTDEGLGIDVPIFDSCYLCVMQTDDFPTI